MFHTTGLHREQVIDLCARVYSETVVSGRCMCPPILGLFKSVVATLPRLIKTIIALHFYATA